jgi:hypothetical protein
MATRYTWSRALIGDNDARVRMRNMFARVALHVVTLTRIA